MNQPDLLDYLVDEYRKDRQEQHKEAEKTWDEATMSVARNFNSYNDKLIGEFVKFARDKLKANPPKSVYTAIQGIGLKLMDGTEVPVLPQPATGMDHQYAVPVFGQGNVGGMSPNRTTAIFSGE